LDPEAIERRPLVSPLN